MLTPLGAGVSARRPRRWPKVLAVLLVLALLAGAGYGVWWWLSQRTGDAAVPRTGPTKTCTTPTLQPPKNLPAPADVTVAVGNGTDRPGLAVETADALVKRGFVVSSIGNAGQPVKEGVAQVRYAKGDLAAAVVVASYVPGANLTERDRANGVALWLGPQFDGVSSTDDANPDAVTLPSGKPVCRQKK